MAAEYEFREMPSKMGEKKEKRLFPRVVSKGTISNKQIIREISEASTFTPADLEGMLKAFEDKITFYLEEGYHVEFGHIGFFSTSLTSRPITSPKEIRSPSITFNKVKFRPTSDFQRKSGPIIVERARNGSQHSSALSEAERQSRLLSFLETHPFMTRADYSSITGLLKNKSLADLNRYIDEGLIDYKGCGCHKVYVRRASNDLREEEQ